VAGAPATAPTWLEGVYAARRQRTRALVEAAVAALEQTRRPVSVASVAAESKRVDPEGRGVSESAVLNNPEARAHYAQHRSWARPRAGRPAATTGRGRGVVRPLMASRDPARARRRYLRMRKSELADRLVVLERAHAEHAARWLRANDDALAWMLVVLRLLTPGGGDGERPD
jgi:hypothetical protein